MSFSEESTRGKNIERQLTFKCAACGTEFVWAYSDEFLTRTDTHYDGWAICFDTPNSKPKCEWCTAFSIGVLEGVMTAEGESDGTFSHGVTSALEKDVVLRAVAESIALAIDGGGCDD